MSVSWSVSTVLETVGALSIIRFRTAIKEPVEIVFLFWSLAVGIVVGAGLLPLAVIGSALIGVILLLFANRKVRNDPYILVLNCTDETAELRGQSIQGQLDGTIPSTEEAQRDSDALVDASDLDVSVMGTMNMGGGNGAGGPGGPGGTGESDGAEPPQFGGNGQAPAKPQNTENAEKTEH